MPAGAHRAAAALVDVLDTRDRTRRDHAAEWSGEARVVERWTRARVPDTVPEVAPRSWRDRASSLIGFVAVVQVVLAVLSLIGPVAEPVPWTTLRLLTMVLYAVTGMCLLGLGAGNPAAVALGFTNLGVASAFAMSVGQSRTAWLPATLELVFDAVLRMPGDLALLVGVWTFAQHFPRTEVGGRVDGLVARLSGVAIAGAAVIFLLNAWLEVVGRAQGDGISALAAFVDRRARDSGYWSLVFPMIVLAIPIALTKQRAATGVDRRRVRHFLLSLAAGLGPIALLSAAGASSPAAATFLRQPDVFPLATMVVFGGLWTLPVSTAIAVSRGGALEIRVILRRSLQRSLARSTLTMAMVVPLAGALLSVWAHADQPVRQLLQGAAAWWLLASVGAGVLALYRREILLRVDRLFLHPRADVHRLVTDAVSASRRAVNVHTAAFAFISAVDAAAHPRNRCLLVRDKLGGGFHPVVGNSEALSAESAIAGVLEASPAAFVADPLGQVVARLLPADDRSWVACNGWAVLVPVFSDRDEMFGIVCLGPQQSDGPYLDTDLSTIETLCTAVGPLLAARIAPRTSGAEAPGAVAGFECATCGCLTIGAHTCPSCATSVVPSVLPETLGHYRVLRRVGRGGMGVVYQALDERLKRHVALKALPALGPAGIAQLTAEAEVMARVTHPGLAFVLGLERFEDVPVVVIEYMDRGTVADLLRAGPLPVHRVLELGVMLAGTLEHLHGQGIIHRDIKPSNVGVTATGHCKLLDLGIAVPVGSGAVAGGTPAYLSPESAAGAPPTVDADLWALAVLLYECATGRHPLDVAGIGRGVISAVKTRGVWDRASASLPGDGPFTPYLRQALQFEPAQRFRSASAARLALDAVRDAATHAVR